MFGLGRRDERAVEAVREEMSAADTRARAVLADAMAQIESRLSNDHDETARLQASTQAAIENLRYEVASRPADIGPVLEQVAAMCALVAERLEADRLERRALTEAITLLARPGLVEGPSRVIGGTVVASSDVSLDDDSHAYDAAPIEAVASVAIEPVNREFADVRTEAPTTVDVTPSPFGASAVIDLTEEERETEAPGSGTEAWNAFEKDRIEPVDEADQLDLRPRQGTRLTAARRSNAGVSYR